MRETDIMRAVQIEASKRGWRLFRNNTGLFWAGHPCPACILCSKLRRVRSGLAVGSSDLIGWKPGGQFVALEVKTSRGITSKAQAAFLKQVIRDGGDGRIIRSVAEFLDDTQS